MNIILILENCLKRTNPFIRFLLVGVVNTLVGLTIMLSLLHLMNLSYWVATFVGNTVGALVSYLLNRSFTFNSNVSHQRGFLRFIMVIGFCYFLSYGFSEVFVKWINNAFVLLDVDLMRVWAVLLGTCLYTATNYVGQKYLVFKKAV